MLQVNLEDLNFRESPRAYMDRIASNHYQGKELNINGFSGYTAKCLTALEELLD